jgi:predicted RNA-binding Zn-ribbon protein involved in translation (DUF1610 family)
MADLIKLVCPTCGGKLKVSKNASSLTCQFCGNEHLVKHEAGGAVMLEAYARCPTCGRNDKAEKVSAVIASQSHEISGVEQKSEVITNAQGQQQTVVRDVPFTRRQVSVLGQRLAAPPPPDPSSFPPFPTPSNPPSRRGGVMSIVLGTLGVLLSFVFAISALSSFVASMNTYSGASDLAMTGVVFAVLGIGAFLVGCGLVALGIVLIVRANKARPELMKRYQEQVEAVKREHARIQGNHERALARWKDLYYCARDDCVFIPGERTAAPVARMNEYLAQLPPNPSPG